MKYIVLKVTDHSNTCDETDNIREVPVVFPDALVHSDVAEAITRVIRRSKPDGRQRSIEPVSAGFFTSMIFATNAGKFCQGKSESLGLKSRPLEDSKLLANYDYSHGVKS